jgi:hypothetical protein
MQSPRSHQFAAAVLALGGGLLGTTALAIFMAHVVVAAGIPGVVAKPQDVALLGDLVAVLPFIVTFAAFNVVAAIALMVGRSWAVTVASWVAGVAITIGLLGLVLLIAGSGTTPAADPGRAGDADGLAIISLFLCLYTAAAVALRVSGLQTRPFPAAAAAA